MFLLINMANTLALSEIFFYHNNDPAFFFLTTGEEG